MAQRHGSSDYSIDADPKESKLRTTRKGCSHAGSHLAPELRQLLSDIGVSNTQPKDQCHQADDEGVLDKTLPMFFPAKALQQFHFSPPRLVAESISGPKPFQPEAEDRQE